MSCLALLVSSVNQSPQVIVPATACAAALSLQKAQFYCVCVCCSVSQHQTLFSSVKRTRHMLPHQFNGHSV